LNFATFAVIESLRSNSELCNIIINDNSNNTTINYGSNYLPLTLSWQQQLFNNIYAALILEEAEKLYNDLTIELTNRSIGAAAAIR
jgi:hypothetical protein